MYYLRKEPYKQIIPEIRKTDGEVIPERECMVEDRAIFKHHDFSRFYRGAFTGIDGRYQGMKLYTCKTLKKILELRTSMLEYSGELFDVYNEDGKVELEGIGNG
jgi:hypothetical protein